VLRTPCYCVAVNGVGGVDDSLRMNEGGTHVRIVQAQLHPWNGDASFPELPKFDYPREVNDPHSGHAT